MKEGEWELEDFMISAIIIKRAGISPARFFTSYFLFLACVSTLPASRFAATVALPGEEL